MKKQEQYVSMAIIGLIVVQTVLLGLLVWRIRSMEERLALMQMSVSEALISPRVVDSAAEGSPFLAEVEAGDGPFRGAEEAPVTIVEFSDFTCSACQQFQGTLKKTLEDNGESVRLVYRYFPLAQQGKPMLTALAGECSHRQGKFWLMHDALFAAAHEIEGEEDIRRLATELGLQQPAFDQCLASEDARRAVEEDAAAGRDYGVNSTPTVFINGRRVRGAVSTAFLNQLVEGFLAREQRMAEESAEAAGSP